MQIVLPSTEVVEAAMLVDNLGNVTGIASNPLPVSQAVGGSTVSPTNPIPIYDGYQAPVANTWNASTTVNTAAQVNTAGMDTVIVTLVANSSVTGGQVIFELFDGVTWLPVKAPTIIDYTTVGSVNLSASYSKGFQVPVAGFPNFRVRLSSALTGSGAQVIVTQIVSSAPDVSLVTVGLDPAQPLPAGTNVLGYIANPAAGVTGQGLISAANTAQQLTATSQSLNNGVTVKCLANGPMTVGFSNSLTSATNGTGNGWVLQTGDSVPIGITNSNLVYVCAASTSCAYEWLGN